MSIKGEIKMNEENIKKFAEMINKSHKTVFFGGAGVSTESGVKDFRSKDGLYNTVKEYGISPETILSRSFFDEHPDTFYDFYYKFFLEVNVEPNAAHYALAELEKTGKLSSVITQNIDGLHQRAGSRNVLELHGTTAKHYCPECFTPYPVDRIRDLKGKVPHCKKCNAVIKPEVVLYEEPLNEEVVEKAVNEIVTADLLIIGGTSLVVYPAAMYVRYFRGENLVLINKSETQYDSSADLVFRDSIGQVLSETVKLVK